MTATLCAKYKNVDGWHVFQSDELPGLYVASQHAETAFNDIAPSMELLMRLNEGIECKVTPVQSFREFVDAMRHEVAAPEPEGLVLSDRRFVVTAGAAAA